MSSFLRVGALLGLLSTSAVALDAGSVRASWFAGWHADETIEHPFTLTDVSWDKYTHMTFSFAETTPDGSLDLSGSGGEGLLTDFVTTAQANNVKALVSVGGWTGSRFWSSSVGSAENRTAFVKTLTDFVDTYKLDGLDFDWEYPNNQGLGCNVISSNDTANYLEFLRELRDSLDDDDFILTAATAITPFMDSTGSPSADVSAFADELTYVAIMNYDLWGSWSTSVGPNAPLNDSCAPEEAQQGSAVSAVNAWSEAGFPKEKLVLGVGSYGHSFTVSNDDAFDGNSTTLALYAPFDADTHQPGDAWDDAGGEVDVCGNPTVAGGNWDFWALIEAGYLDAQGNNVTEYPYTIDPCTQTAYLYDESKELEVSFDSATTFTTKGQFIMEQGLAGFAMWEAGGDHGDILLDAITSPLSKGGISIHINGALDARK